MGCFRFTRGRRHAWGYWLGVRGVGRPVLRACPLVEAPDGSKAGSKGRTQFSDHVIAAPRSEGKIFGRCRILPG